MNLQTILDKFDEKFTTIEVIKSCDGSYFAFNQFDVVPVRCDMSYFWDDDGREVENSFFVDAITLDTSDNTITFELADRTKEMRTADEIISLDVVKVSRNQYLQAIKDDQKPIF